MKMCNIDLLSDNCFPTYESTYSQSVMACLNKDMEECASSEAGRELDFPTPKKSTYGNAELTCTRRI